MTSRARVGALLMAAGSGRRFGETSKLMEPFCGARVIDHALAALAQSDAIHKVVPVIGENIDAPRVRERVAKGLWPKIEKAVMGADTRQGSVYAGLMALEGAADFVLVHDAARPWLHDEVIKRAVEALHNGAEGVSAAMPLHDSLCGVAPSETSSLGRCTSTVSREKTMLLQTPQGGRLECLRDAHEQAIAQGRAFTDDATLLSAYGYRVDLVAGHQSCQKITVKNDLKRIEALECAQVTRVGQGFDVHAFGEGNHLFLGGVRIDHPRGLIGHSDADLLLHAICDAMLGTLGEGDIGDHFPPSDPRYAGMKSSVFVEKVHALLKARGGRLVHLDCTLIGENPKLGRHKTAIQDSVAELLGIEKYAVGIKATTTERLGFTGREEGLAALVNASVLFPFRRQIQ